MTLSDHPVVINGSHGEGGSALFKTALAVACLTQQPVRIHNIRGAMRKNGMTSEDLTVVHALQASTAADVVGDELGSNNLTFTPTKRPRGLNQRFDIGEYEKGTIPGNALVVLEAVLPVLARSGMYSKLVIQGETYNPRALTFDYFDHVTLAAHRRQGVHAFAHQAMAGFGFGAKGEVGLEIEPSVPQAIRWSDRGELTRLRGIVAHSEIADQISIRGVEQLHKKIRAMGYEPEIENIEVRSREPGAFVTVWAEFERGMAGFTSMGAKGHRMESVAQVALDALAEWMKSDATVDPFLADQLVLTASLADGETVFKTPAITSRLITIAWVIKQFLPIHITILGREGEPGKVTISR